MSELPMPEVRVQSAREWHIWLEHNHSKYNRAKVVIFASAVCVPSISKVTLAMVAKDFGWAPDDSEPAKSLIFRANSETFGV